jgi:hypothetical protein
MLCHIGFEYPRIPEGRSQKKTAFAVFFWLLLTMQNFNPNIDFLTEISLIMLVTTIIKLSF